MLLLLHLLWLSIACLGSVDDPLGPYRDEAKKWEAEIQQLEKLDRERADPEHAILFVGSSSIRLWKTIEEDMQPWPVIQRGFGGCKMTDVAIYAERLIHPHQYDAVVLFAANDILGSEADRSPETVGIALQKIIDVSRQHAPHAPVLVIAITPTESRWPVWPKIQEANRTLNDICGRNPKVHFVDTVASYLSKEGLPRSEFFVEDRLHQNALGYQTWARHIKEGLQRAIP